MQMSSEGKAKDTSRFLGGGARNCLQTDRELEKLPYTPKSVTNQTNRRRCRHMMSILVRRRAQGSPMKRWGGGASLQNTGPIMYYVFAYRWMAAISTIALFITHTKAQLETAHKHRVLGAPKQCYHQCHICFCTVKVHFLPIWKEVPS